MKKKSLIRNLIYCLVVLALALEICSFPISSSAPNRNTITPFIWEDPYEPSPKIQLNHLLNNTVKDEDGDWVTSGGIFLEKWSSYNCYAYAIRMPIGRIRAGFMGGGDYEPDSATVHEVALLAKNDLENMGYSNVELHSEIPEINEEQELICLRKTVPDSDETDFHYMRYDYGADAWYHKPGGTAILKYNGVPNNNISWPLEVVNATGMWLYPNTVYGGEIIYITYSKNLINVGQDVSKSINAGKEILCEINIDTLNEYDLFLTSTYSNNYFLYNEDLDLLLEGSGTYNVAQIELSPGKYYLRVNFGSYDEGASSVNIRITDMHTHSYSYQYEQYSNNAHKAFCVCGYNMLISHTMNEHECTLCGYSAHSYEYISVDGSTHSITCSCGVNILVEHDMQNGTCVDCGYHVHSYTDHYQYKSMLQHYCYCRCGESILRPHVLRQSDGGGMTVSICEYCDAMVGGPGVLNGVYTDLPHTENGSYILPNGIIVLVPEDEEAYFNGTLVFSSGEIM